MAASLTQNLSSDTKSLWIGELEPWMDEPFISKAFNELGFGSALLSIKIRKDKNFDQTTGYGFLQFDSKETAQHVLQTFNYTVIPHTNKQFKLNWAVYGANSKSSNTNPKGSDEFSIYVGGLDRSITQNMLMEFFKSKYPSVYSAKIISDPITKFSKGYGFVMFHSPEQADKALVESNGLKFAGKPIKVSSAHSGKTQNQQSIIHGSSTNIQLPKDDQPLSSSQKQQLYDYYISLLNDPVMKLEYERQLQILYGIDVRQLKKKTLKNQLDSIAILDYQQSQKSQEYLYNLPKVQNFRERLNIEAGIFR